MRKKNENTPTRKTLKEELTMLLQMEQTNGKTVQENWMFAIASKLLKGDIKASIFVRDILSEQSNNEEFVIKKRRRE